MITVFKKLLSPKCSDVFEPARQQFNGKGSYGNGGAMRVAGIPLAYSNVQDVKKVHWLLTSYFCNVAREIGCSRRYFSAAKVSPSLLSFCFGVSVILTIAYLQLHVVLLLSSVDCSAHGLFHKDLAHYILKESASL